MTIFLSGQKQFGADVLRMLISEGHTVAGVCVPVDDRRLAPLAALHKIPIVPGGSLTPDAIPPGVDIGVTAHSFDYVGRPCRTRPRLGWIGYHPSLLPRHRGRSAIEWALRMRDFATGGTVYWLNAGIDRGDIERQEMVWVNPALTVGDFKANAAELWRSDLAPLGVRLLRDALRDISKGRINAAPQDARFSTFEPCADAKDVYRPDRLLLEALNP